jgi:CRISPR system Cascade subunit CasC
MTDADILQFHLLTAFPPHNVNRDEDGRPKTCVFGDVQRGRISSQSRKRAVRFAPHFQGGQRATRTRQAGILAFRKLTGPDDGIDRVSAAWAALAVNFALGGGGKVPTLENVIEIATPTKKPAVVQREKDIKTAMSRHGMDRAAAELRVLEQALQTGQGLVVSTREFQRLDQQLAALVEAWNTNRDGFPKALEAWVKALCKDSLLTHADHDLDTALFGRMVAADPNFNVEAACAVSHAFTTHKFTVEGDYFSAGEELNELGGTGAAITSYGFFGGGVYYQHAVLDRSHLRLNLSARADPAEAEVLVAEAVGTLLNGLLFAQPKGKRNSFASDVAANYVLVTKGADPAINLGFAFLDPVDTGEDHDLLKGSITRLRAYYDTIAAAYGLKNALCVFNAHPAARQGNAPAAPEVWTFDDLRGFVLGEPA